MALSDGVSWLGLLVALVYGVSSLSMAFINKAVLSTYNFDYPFFILSVQMTLSITVLELLSSFGVVNVQPYTLTRGRSFFWPSFFCGIHGAVSLYALKGLNIPMYGAMKRCSPIINLVLSVVLLKKALPSVTLALSIVMITFGCVIAALGDLTYDHYAYTFSVVSVMAQGLYLSLVQYHSEHHNYSSLQILQLNSYNTLLPFILFSSLLDEPKYVSDFKGWSDPSFVFMFILVVSMGCILNYSLFLCTTVNSALTTSLVGVPKSTMTTIIGFFTFGGVAYHPLNVAGIVINLVGGILYVYAKYKDKKRDQALKTYHDYNSNNVVNKTNPAGDKSQNHSPTNGFIPNPSSAVSASVHHHNSSNRMNGHSHSSSTIRRIEDYMDIKIT